MKSTNLDDLDLGSQLPAGATVNTLPLKLLNRPNYSIIIIFFTGYATFSYMFIFECTIFSMKEEVGTQKEVLRNKSW